jgi:malate dehydrogenase (oxaloacetate-decarboxylating)
MDDWDVFAREAAAVGMKAQEQGLARLKMSYEALYDNALAIIQRSRDLTQALMRDGYIRECPDEA